MILIRFKFLWLEILRIDSKVVVVWDELGTYHLPVLSVSLISPLLGHGRQYLLTLRVAWLLGLGLFLL